MTDAKQTPLTELLRRAPRDMSILHESPDQQGTMSTAVGRLMHEAADEIERLTANIKKANDQAEHFEREWYLRGDEIERLTAERDEARAERDAMAKDAARYRFLSCKGVPPHSYRWSRWRLEYWNGEWWDQLMKEELDAAIDAQIEKDKANGSR